MLKDPNLKFLRGAQEAHEGRRQPKAKIQLKTQLSAGPTKLLYVRFFCRVPEIHGHKLETSQPRIKTLKANTAPKNTANPLN